MDNGFESAPSEPILQAVDFEHLDRSLDLERKREVFLASACALYIDPSRAALKAFRVGRGDWQRGVETLFNFLVDNHASLTSDIPLAELIMDAYLREDWVISTSFAEITADDETFYMLQADCEYIDGVLEDLRDGDAEDIKETFNELLEDLAIDARNFELKALAQDENEWEDESPADDVVTVPYGEKINKSLQSKYAYGGKVPSWSILELS